MRLLILANAFPAPARPAFGSYVEGGARTLAELGHDVRVVALAPGRRGRIATPAAYAGLGARSLAAAIGWRPDAILAHYLVPTGTIARRAAAFARVPYVLVAHGTDVSNAEQSPRLREATLRAVSAAAGVVCVSEQLAERLEVITGPLGDRRHVISAGVDSERFRPGDRELAATALGWDAPGPRICQVGNLVEVKNPLRLLEAFAELRREQPGASLALVGGGPLHDALQERARELGVADAVELPGELTVAEAGRWLRAADCAALVSLREGFGLAVVEALASGRPVAVSATAGAASLVQEGVTGALLDPLDVGSIVRALSRVAQLDPGSAAIAAAAPYAREREMGRLADVLAGAIRRAGRPAARG